MRTFSSAERYFFDSIVNWLALAGLIFGPWVYGSARDDHASFLALWMGVTFILASLKWAFIDRRFPRLPLIPLLLLIALNAQGWIMTANPIALFDKSLWEFVLIHKAYPSLPGTWDHVRSMTAMWIITGLSLGFIVLADIASDALWRRRMLMTMAINGAVTATFGILVKAIGYSCMEIIWNRTAISDTNFAFYRYHGNAAVFLYITWPLALAFALGSLNQARKSMQYMVWFLVFGLIFLGVMVNISKAGVLISVIMLTIFLRWRKHVQARRQTQSIEIAREQSSLMPRVYTILAHIILACGLFYIVASALNSISGWSRWVDLQNDTAMSRTILDRLLVYISTIDAIPKAGYFGFGPDSFPIVFPTYARTWGNNLYGFWRYAHEDYLQTIFEWGWIGASMWGLLYWGGILRGIWNWWKPSNFNASEDRMLLFACLLGLIATAVHALVDFPFQIASLRLYLLALLAVCWNSHYFAKETVAEAPKIRRRRRANTSQTESPPGTDPQS